MKIQIAIPSYQRAETLCKKTLKYLIGDCAFPQDDINVFCADKTEADKYETVLKAAGYGEVLIQIGEPTLRNQRNYIQQFFEEGDLVLNFDDDVDGLFYAKDKKLHLFTDITGLAERMNAGMVKHKTKISGVYPVANHFFMGDKTTSDNRYIVGCFWACIIDHDTELGVDLEDKEDFERTIKYFIKFGAVVRLEDICVQTKYYKEPGGMQVTRTKQRVHDSAMFLIQKYPDHCVLNTAKANKEFTEIKLITPSVLKQDTLW